jgi:DNA primase
VADDIRGDIMALAQEYLGDSVKRTRHDNIMALCPFHRKADGTAEHTASFTMSLRRGIYFCFACKQRGTLESFLEHFGVPLIGLEHVIEMARAHAAEDRDNKRDGLAFLLDPIEAEDAIDTPLPEELLGLFQYLPEDMEREGFTEQTLKEFDIGVDLVHQRTTFPIRNHRGELVGISGRARANQRSRYKVYTYEYADFGLPPRDLEKSHLLWNYHRVLNMRFEPGHDGVILVEGFKAAMWLHQAGYHGVIALMGSSLSEEQCTLISMLGSPIFMMLDNDDAGKKGTVIAAGMLQKELIDLSIIQYEAKQPSDIPVSQLHSIVTNAVTYIDWVFEQHPNET